MSNSPKSRNNIKKIINDKIDHFLTDHSFSYVVKKERNRNKDFENGLNALKEIKSEHKQTILELVMVMCNDYEKSYLNNDPDHHSKWEKISKIQNLPKIFSRFIPTTNNPLSPYRTADRDNLLEEIYRFRDVKMKYGSVAPENIITEKFNAIDEKFDAIAKKLGQPRVKRDDKVNTFFARLGAAFMINDSGWGEDFAEGMDESIEAIRGKNILMQLKQEGSITVYDRVIDTKNLSNKLDKLVQDLEQFKKSEGGKAVLNFDRSRNKH